MCPRRANPVARDDLIDAAREEFARRGVAGARVEDIARRAGLSKGAFYLHFRTKEEVFREILARLLGALGEHAARREESGAAGAARDVHELIARECRNDEELLETLWRNRKIVAALDGAAAGLSAPMVLDFRRRMRDLVAARIGAHQRDGLLRPDLDPRALGDLVLGAYEAFARRMVDLRERPDLAGWARGFLTTFYLGALASPPRDPPANVS